MVKLKQAILDSGYTNKHLAKVLEVHQTEISQWIAGRRDVPRTKKGKLARILKCKMSELYGE
jgi:DNA-binding transcriptional regulator YdaS (Cro superfamily)